MACVESHLASRQISLYVKYLGWKHGELCFLSLGIHLGQNSNSSLFLFLSLSPYRVVKNHRMYRAFSPANQSVFSRKLFRLLQPSLFLPRNLELSLFLPSSLCLSQPVNLGRAAIRGALAPEPPRAGRLEPEPIRTVEQDISPDFFRLNLLCYETRFARKLGNKIDTQSGWIGISSGFGKHRAQGSDDQRQCAAYSHRFFWPVQCR